jgi:hypothetical protein
MQRSSLGSVLYFNKMQEVIKLGYFPSCRKWIKKKKTVTIYCTVVRCTFKARQDLRADGRKICSNVRHSSGPTNQMSNVQLQWTSVITTMLTKIFILHYSHGSTSHFSHKTTGFQKYITYPILCWCRLTSQNHSHLLVFMTAANEVTKLWVDSTKANFILTMMKIGRVT